MSGALALQRSSNEHLYLILCLQVFYSDIDQDDKFRCVL